MNELSEKCTVKALNSYQNRIVEGYLFTRNDGSTYVISDSIESISIFVVNPYTICRNTGIKDCTDKYIYEFDIIQYRDLNNDIQMAIIVFDDFTSGWAAKTSANYGGIKALKKCTDIRSIGNAVLSDDDANKFQQWSDTQDASYSGIRAEPECRSTQHINKLNREFLPK